MNINYGYSGSTIYYPSASGLSYSSVRMEPQTSVDLDKLAQKLFDKMHTTPVVIQCRHCLSHNTITNTVCIRCGAPFQ